MGWFSDITNAVSSAVTAPFKWQADAVEWVGDRTGIKPLSDLGGGVHNLLNTPAAKTAALAIPALAAGIASGGMSMPAWLSSILPESMAAATGAAGGAAEGLAAGSSGSILPSLTEGLGGLAVNMPGGATALTGANGALIPASILAGGATGAATGALSAKGAALPSLTEGAGGLAVNAPGGVSLTGSDGALFPMSGGTASSTPGFLNSAWNSASKMFNNAMPNFGAASELGGGAMKPPTSLMGGLGNYTLPLMALGLGSDYFAQKGNVEQEEGSKNALNNAIAANSWTPARRAEYMKGINAELQSALAGSRRRAGGSAAARGVGGGGYGDTMSKAYSDAMSNAVKSLGSTFVPDANLITPTATANSPTKSATSRWLSDLTNLAGSYGSNMMNMQMLQQILGR